MNHPRVLIVEDDRAIRTLLVAAFRREPVAVDTACDGVAALELVQEHDYAVILLDLMMPRLDGFGFLEQFERVRRGGEPVTIVMTAFDVAALRQLSGLRVQGLLHKPFDVEWVVEMVRDCAYAHQEQQLRIQTEQQLRLRTEPKPATEVAANVPDEPWTLLAPGAYLET